MIGSLIFGSLLFLLRFFRSLGVWVLLFCKGREGFRLSWWRGEVEGSGMLLGKLLMVFIFGGMFFRIRLLVGEKFLS